MKVSLKEMLDEREKIYGNFDDFATLCQCIKQILIEKMDFPDHFYKEALEMIIHKICRIANGGVDGITYIDNWRDIAGYAQLVVNIMESRKNESIFITQSPTIK